jgi:hypothetical protein
VTYVDEAILNATELFCHRFQRLTGRTNVWLAVQLTNLSVIVYFVWAALYFSSVDTALRIAVGLFCAGVLYVLTQTVFRVPIEESENSAYRRVAKGYRNPRRVRDAIIRISFLTLSVLLGYPLLFAYSRFHVRMALLSYILVVLMTILMYLLACDPLPPCRGTSRDRLFRFGYLRNVVHGPEGREVLGEERLQAVELRFHRGPILGMRGEVEQDRSHRLGVDGESFVTDRCQVVGVHLVGVIGGG